MPTYVWKCSCRTVEIVRPMALSHVPPDDCKCGSKWVKQITSFQMLVPGGTSEKIQGNGKDGWPKKFKKLETTLIQDPKTGAWKLEKTDKVFNSPAEQREWLKANGKVLHADLIDNSDKNGSRHVPPPKGPSDEAVAKHEVLVLREDELVEGDINDSILPDAPLSEKETRMADDMFKEAVAQL